MPSQTSLRGAEKNVQDWISLVCGALLFISPWALGFAGDLMAARTAWVGGIVIAVMAIAALVQFARQTGQFDDQAALPAKKIVRGKLCGGHGDGLVQRQHSGQFLDGEEALQTAPRAEIFAGGDDRRHW